MRTKPAWYEFYISFLQVFTVKYKPLTLEQAEQICNNYHFLEGMPYDKEFTQTTAILSVVVAPYKEETQTEFMDDFDLLGYTDLKAYQSGDGYDVIVIARYQPDEDICLWMDIRSFVRRNMQEVSGYRQSYIRLKEGNELAAWPYSGM